MTQQEFLEKFHPDYDKIVKEIGDIKLILATKFNTYVEIVGYNKQIQYLLDKGFEEALQNFTHKICEAQKEICASGSSVYLNINSRPYPDELIAIIIGSVHPNMEEL
jgi:hypothetical protein